MRRRDVLVLIGAAATLHPPAAHAQQKAMPVIGWLHFGSRRMYSDQLAAFRLRLSQSGYVEGQNVTIEYRWAEDRYDRLPALAADFVSNKAAVITAIGGASARAAKAATSTIPIVFMTGSDPVADGLAASLARPGGNLTGLSFLFGELHAKRLELLSELIPEAKTIAFLVDPSFATEPLLRDVQDAARARGLQLHVLKARNEAEIDAAFASLDQQHADALLVGSDPVFDSWHEQLIALASSHTIPAIYPWRVYPDSGGLMSYGPDLAIVTRQLAIYIGKILMGAKPADLPIEQPTRFELVINLKTAKTLGLTVPQSILARADEVIE
jgi:putative ABC transport system substrate-binding protein